MGKDRRQASKEYVTTHLKWLRKRNRKIVSHMTSSWVSHCSEKYLRLNLLKIQPAEKERKKNHQAEPKILWTSRWRLKINRMLTTVYEQSKLIELFAIYEFHRFITNKLNFMGCKIVVFKVYKVFSFLWSRRMRLAVCCWKLLTLWCNKL